MERFAVKENMIFHFPFTFNEIFNFAFFFTVGIPNS